MAVPALKVAVCAPPPQHEPDACHRPNIPGQVCAYVVTSSVHAFCQLDPSSYTCRPRGLLGSCGGCGWCLPALSITMTHPVHGAWAAILSTVPMVDHQFAVVRCMQDNIELQAVWMLLQLLWNKKHREIWPVLKVRLCVCAAGYILTLTHHQSQDAQIMPSRSRHLLCSLKYHEIRSWSRYQLCLCHGGCCIC